MRRRQLPLLAIPILARAAELRLLSAGAVEPGLEPAVEAFRRATGTPVGITYATAPRLRERMQAGETPDLLIAPVGLINELVTAGRLTSERATLGRVGAGVVVRAGAPEPDIGDAAALRLAVETAQTLVFNRASTGLHMDRVFEAWGLTTAITPRVLRFATGAEVLERILAGQGAELGFAAITEIRMVPALRYLGPLPAEVQNYTSYAVALLPQAMPEAAELLRLLTSPASRALLDAAGVGGLP